MGTTGDGYAYVTRGKVKTALQDTLGALADFNQALTENPKNIDGYFGRGFVEILQSKYKEAIQDMTIAINLYAGDAPAFRYRGVAKQRLGDNEGAIKDFIRETELEPGNQDAFLRLGKVLNENKRYSESLSYLNKIITPATKNGKLLITRGEAMGGLGDTKGALEQFDKAAAVDSNVRSLALSSKAGIEYRLKDYDAAEKDLAIAIQKDQNNDEAYFLRANLKMLKKNYQGAEYDYISVLLINPDNIKTYAYRGLAESYIPDTAAMNSDFRYALKLSPKSDNNYLLRGKAKINMHDTAGALTDFNSAIEINPSNADAWLNRGLLKETQGDKTGACIDLNKAVATGSTDAKAEVTKYCNQP